MAKGDDKRVRNAIDTEQDRGTDILNNVRTGQTERQWADMWNKNVDAGNIDQQNLGTLMGGFRNFAETGGWSPNDMSNFRARAVSPIRSAYANAGREVDRARALQGGSMPGYAALRARMARDMGQGMSDAAINAEAGMQDQVRQGRLAGLQGGTNLYGTTPGLSALTSRNLLGATSQNIDVAGMDINRGMGLLSQRNQAAQIPGAWETGLNTIGRFAGNIGGAIAPWADMIGGGGAGGAGGVLPSYRPPSGIDPMAPNIGNQGVSGTIGGDNQYPGWDYWTTPRPGG